MKLRVLVIDDKRKMRFLNKEAKEGKIDLTYAETVEEAIDALNAHSHFDEVWWDHDDGTDKTFRPAALLLESLGHEGTAPTITTNWVHTDNPAGGEYLMAALKNIYSDVRRTRIHIDELGTGI